MNILSKREQIAAMAMTGLLGNARFLTRVLDDPTRSQGEGFTDGEIVARVAMHMTDTLLAELDRTEKAAATKFVGTVLRAGTGSEGNPRVSVGVVKEHLKHFEGNILGREVVLVFPNIVKATPHPGASAFALERNESNEKTNI